MSSIDERFRQLRTENRKALIPFITAGDPDLEFTRQVLLELDQAGASVLEVGIPYSDPIADGPIIQASYTRSLQRGIRVPDILATLGRTTPELQSPVVTMVSYAIIHRYGKERYVADAREAGIAGAIVPDLLVEEADEFAQLCRRADFSLIQLVTPTTPRDRAVRIAQQSSGFLYYVSVTGITGERRELPPELLDNVRWLRGQTDLPICIGFGISQPEHVRALREVADGLIVGSAIVRRMAEAEQHGREKSLQDVASFTRQLVSALA
ncbi:MAG: tryptophan synthase subunit alpha [Pirellulales bacterium]